MVKRFLASRRTGFYFRVLKEGEVGAGDAIKRIGRDENNVTVADITRLYVRDGVGPELLRRVIQVEALSEGLRGYFRKQMQRAGS